MNTRHITRFTYEFTNFQGWRVAINRQGISLARYFSDKQHGDSEKAFEQALNFRDEVLRELKQNPDHVQEILLSYRSQERRTYPAGLKPALTPPREGEHTVSSFSMRSNKVLHHVLQRMCKQLKLDTASVLKLSLYLFAVQYSAQGVAEEITSSSLSAPSTIDGSDTEQHANTLQRIISELESAGRNIGMPDFEEFSTGRPSGRKIVPTTDVLSLYDNSHAAERYMRSARPSPPQTPASNTMQENPPSHSTVSHSSPQAPTPSSLPKPVCKRQKSHFFPYSPDGNPTRPQSRKRARSRDDIDIVPPPDAM